MEIQKITLPASLDKVLVDSNLTLSRTEAKRLIVEGGVRVDGEVVRDPSFQVTVLCLSRQVEIQVGRRKFVKVEQV